MREAAADSAKPQYVLAVDLGSSNVRAALVSADGAIAASARCEAPALHSPGLSAELDACDWWHAVVALAAQLAAAVPEAFGDVAALAVGGATRIQVLLDEAGNPVRPALHWSDTRAEEQVARLRHLAAGHAEAAQINAFHPLARLAFVAAHEPAVFQRTAHVVDPKDFINARLTGRVVSDPVSLARLIGAKAGSDLVAAAVGPGDFLPPLIEPWQCVGPVLPGLPAPLDQLAGLPVVCGSHDTFAAVVGLGAMRPGYAYNISGTTEVLGVLSSAPALAAGLISIDWRAAHQLGGPSQNGADVVAWLTAILGVDMNAQGLNDLLRQPRAPQPLLFLPYLRGERVPYWDGDLRGGFIGLAREHGATDLAWAVLEGIAFQNRIVLEQAEAAIGEPCGELRFGGGGAAIVAWRQLKADVLGRNVVTTTADEAGLIGAAALGFVGTGRFGTLADAQETMVRVGARHVPDPGRRQHLDALYGLFREAEAAAAPISRQLARLSKLNA